MDTFSAGSHFGNSSVYLLTTTQLFQTLTYLVYLQQALKAGSARHAIDGLSHSGKNYKEAIDCLGAALKVMDREPSARLLPL